MIDEDTISLETADEIIELWNKMMIANHHHEEKIFANLHDQKDRCLAVLDRLLGLMESGMSPLKRERLGTAQDLQIPWYSRE